MIRDKEGKFIKGHLVSKEIRDKIGEANKGRKSFRKGKTLEQEYGKRAEGIRQRLSNSHKGKRPNNYGKKMPKYSGDKHWNWQGGRTKLNWQIRESLEYKNWRRKVFKRDNYTCQFCDKRGKGDLHADHIKPFDEILREYHITTFNHAIKCEKLWDINNGRTLCKECHTTTDTYPKNLR